jgi:hypothetical protein
VGSNPTPGTRLGLLRRGDLQAATTPSSTRLADFLDDWLASQKTRLRETTWHSYDHATKRVHHHLGQVSLLSLTTLQIERFYAALVESGGKRRAGLAPKSVRNTHVVLRTLLPTRSVWVSCHATLLGALGLQRRSCVSHVFGTYPTPVSESERLSGG